MFLVTLSLAALAVPSTLRSFDQAVARAPHDADARIRRAVALEVAGERTEALADWQTVADLRPADHRPHLHRARLLAAMRQPDAAMDAVDRAAELGQRVFNQPAAPPPAPMPRIDPLTGVAVPTVTLPPTNPATPAPPGRLVVWLPDDVLTARADLLMSAGRWGDALEVLADLATRRPTDPATQLRFGRALLAWNRHEQAEAAFEVALRTDPTDSTALAGRAVSRAARDLPTTDPLPAAGRAYQKWHAGDADGAADDALAALAEEPASFDLAALAARALLAADRPMTAVVVFSSVLDKPWPAATRGGLLTGRAMAWVRAGSPPAAERDADRAAALDPADPEPLFVRGQIAEARGDYRAAVGEYAALLTRHPAHGHAAFRLALLRATAPDPAVRDGEAAVTLADRLPDGHLAFGLRAAGHAEAGRFARAVTEVNAALAAGPPDGQREQLLRMRAKFLADLPWRGDDDSD